VKTGRVLRRECSFRPFDRSRLLAKNSSVPPHSMPLPSLPSVAIILLAAGESRRMGVPKQLLPVQGQTMVRRAAELARQATAGAVIVVLGANADQVSEALAGLDVERTTNPDWEEGMGTSLRHGILHLAAIAPACPAVLVLLVDQPGIPARHLSALIERHTRFPKHIIASEHHGVTQPPVLFPKSWFARLGSLSGDRGAKAILRDAGPQIQRVPLPTLDDVDTPEDYDAFIKGNEG
jgi:molybdenum cofactor cytidylyltransferase